MNQPKLHHYVPKFYLNYFVGTNGKLCVFDKQSGRHFGVSPRKISAETHFYRLPEPVPESIDSLEIEKNLSALESKSSIVFKKIIDEVGSSNLRHKLSISENERLVLSEYLATQYFRTLELRELLLFFLQDEGLVEDKLSNDEKKQIHFTILSESGILEEFEESIFKSIWIFAKNVSSNPLITSDHPLCIQSDNNRMWRKGLSLFTEGSYVVFPVTPEIILYCKEPIYWVKLKTLDRCILRYN